MPRVVRRIMPDAVIQAAHVYLSNRASASEAAQAMGDKKQGPYRAIADHCRANGEMDDKGSYTWRFDSPLVIGDAKYAGFRLQARQAAPYFDEDKARALIDSLGPEVTAAATHTEVIYDFDHLFLLRQQGRVTGEDLDGVLVTPAREYSLTVLQGD